MFPEDPFPLLARASTLYTAFAIALLIFHGVLILWFKVGKRGWKIVDYIWLALAVLGLAGGAAQFRHDIANSRLSMSDARVDVAYDSMYWLLQEDSKKDGPSCSGPFKDSPPPSLTSANAVAREYGAVCAWFATVAQKFPDKASRKLITAEMLPPDPALADENPNDDPKNIIVGFRHQVAYYNDQVTIRERLVAAGNPTEFEGFVASISPLLLAIALALRVTKVTGELLDQGSSPAPPPPNQSNPPPPNTGSQGTSSGSSPPPPARSAAG